MGCFNVTGFLSHLPICEGEPAVALICKVRDTLNGDSNYHTDLYYTNSQLNPVCLPIYGSYNDYGSLECIEENFTTRFLEKLCGDKISNIMEAVCCIGSFFPTMKSIKERRPEFSHIYDAFKRLEMTSVGGQGMPMYGGDAAHEKAENLKLTVIFEHRDFFLECCKEFVEPEDRTSWKIVDENKRFVKWHLDTYGDRVIAPRHGHYLDFFRDYFRSDLVMSAMDIEFDKFKSMTEVERKVYTAPKCPFEFKSMELMFFNWHVIFPLYRTFPCDFTEIETDEIMLMRGLDIYMLMIQIFHLRKREYSVEITLLFPEMKLNERS